MPRITFSGQARQDLLDIWLHVAPRNGMHKQLVGNCAQCHKAEAWKPATFEHGKFFVLDKDHNATCW